MNKLKMYSSGNVLSYLRLENGRKFDLSTLSEIPNAFNDHGSLEIAYSKSLEKALRKRLRL